MVHWKREQEIASVFLPWEPHEQYEKAKRYNTERWTPRSVGSQYVTGEEWRESFRKNEEMEPKQKQRTVVDVTGDRSKVWCCKEQYCIWTWNVRSMNQGKLEGVEQKMSKVNIYILGISELKLDWNGRIYLRWTLHLLLWARRRNKVAFVVNKRIQNAVLGCNLENDRMIDTTLAFTIWHISKISKPLLLHL